MFEGLSFGDGRLVRVVLAVGLTGFLISCASDPPTAPAPAAAASTGTAAAPASGTATTPASATGKTASAKSAKTKAAKVPKNAVFDEASAIEAGKDACHPISDTYAKEHWRAQNQRGVWRVWVTPVHCEGGGTCPTYEVHITASDGVAGECTQRIALN
jgi:hypothetical protein